MLNIRGSAFHSAHNPEIDVKPCEFHRFADDSIALQHDITKGHLPEAFDCCDCFYAEPPWRYGIKTFNKRAGSDDHSLTDVVRGIAAVIENETRPIALMVSRADLPLYQRLCPPIDKIINTTIGAFKTQYETRVLVWNYKRPLDPMTTKSIRRSLLIDHSCVGDFCCGYGHTAVDARSMNKRFVCSDYNARCIGHLKETL